jgi:H+-translocating NAD(P) transhydrogenase subunit alpha
MIVGVPREDFPGERRVALVPAVVPTLAKAGVEVVLEAGAGVAAGFPDAEYVAKGATLVSSRADLFQRADVIVCVRSLASRAGQPSPDVALLHRGQALVGILDPLGDAAGMHQIAASGAMAVALELVPRTTRAQSMDVLSSMATLVGYRAVLLAAEALPRIFPMMTTAAGTIRPAKVFIVGVGVAGLQAIATAKRLGAVVEAYDVRSAVKEQVESLGARFVELPLETKAAQDAGGYAKAQDEEFYRQQRELMGKVVAASNVVITTAAVPGKKAPLLVTKEMVAGMAPGSVVVDVAAEQGGNCELTRPGERIEVGGVTILGPLNVAASLPYDASQMYARNVATFLTHALKNGWDAEHPEDDIVRDTRVTRAGEVVHARVRELLGLPALALATS